MALPLAVCLAITSATTWLLYTKTQELFRWSIDERLIALASVAAIQFDPAMLDTIGGTESVGTTAYRDTVLRLDRIRRQTRKVRFAYILRRTDDPATLEFVADADSLDPDTPIDLNQDGVIDESDELVRPGDPYDISGFPEFQEAAFVRPFVDPELTEDQWGIFLAGTAPIAAEGDPPQSVRYVLGLDLDVSQFETLKNQALIPFVVFVAFLILVITGLTVLLALWWRRQVEQLAEIDRQKDELISIVSHQINSPLASIRIGLEDVLDGELGPLTDDQRERMGLLVKAARNLAELTSLLLDVSRIELGRLKIDKVPLDLSEFFSALVSMTNDLAQQKGVKFSVSLPPTWPNAALDRRLTRMTLENLLSNAVKYTPAGKNVTFEVTTGDGKLLCRVTDTGVGIPKRDQAKLFTKLYRASNVQHIGGNGFGLYVAKGAVEQQGGRLWFESAENEGTTFFVELPLG